MEDSPTPMPKKYIVRLSECEREELQSVVKKLKDSSQRVRRAQSLLKADTSSPSWSDNALPKPSAVESKPLRTSVSV